MCWGQFGAVCHIKSKSLRESVAKLERAVFGVDFDSLAFPDFAFKDVNAKRIENFLLDGALERTCSVNRVVTFARDQFLRGIGKIERDLLLFEPFRQTAELNFDNLFEVVFSESIENDDLIDPVEKLGSKMRP
jgi:hypothetical protein